MKRKISTLISVGLLAASIVPMVALAQPADNCRLKHNLADTWNNNNCTLNAIVNETRTSAWGMCCILDAVYTVTDWIFIALVAVVSLFTIWGGVTIATAGGAQDKIGQGRNYILWAMIGLAVALLSKAVPSVVKSLIGV